jgi:hypothetical protein
VVTGLSLAGIRLVYRESTGVLLATRNGVPVSFEKDDGGLRLPLSQLQLAKGMRGDATHLLIWRSLIGPTGQGYVVVGSVEDDDKDLTVYDVVLTKGAASSVPPPIQPDKINLA